MNRLSYISILVVLLSGCIYEEEVAFLPSDKFVKNFGTSSGEQTIDIVEIPEGDPDPGYLILGSTTNTGNGTKDYLLIRTDEAGNLVWQNSYNHDSVHVEIDNTVDPPRTTTTPVLSDDNPSSLTIDPVEYPGRALIIGTAFQNDLPNSRIFLVSVDYSTGAITDSISYRFYDDRPQDLAGTEFEYNGYKPTRGADIIVEGDRFIILGSVQTGLVKPSQTNNFNIFMFSIKNDFATQLEDNDWPYIGGQDGGEDLGVKLLEIENDGGPNEYYYMASSEPEEGSFGVGGVDIYIAPFDPFNAGLVSGDADWFGTTDDDIPSNIIAKGLEIYVTGTTGQNVNLDINPSTNRTERAFYFNINKSLTGSQKFVSLELNYDTDPNLTTIVENDDGSRGSDLVITENNDLYIVGQLNNYTDASDVLKQNEMVLFRVSSNGEVLEKEHQIYGSAGNDQGNAILAKRDIDGNLESLVIGATTDFGGSARMITLIKTDEIGALD
jgi:hypothetical protein